MMVNENFKKCVSDFSYNFYEDIFRICEFFNSNYKTISEILRNCEELSYTSVFLNIHLTKEGELCVSTIGPFAINFTFKTCGGDKHSLNIMGETTTFSGLNYGKLYMRSYLVKLDIDNVTNTRLSLTISENQYDDENEMIIILDDLIQFNMFTKTLRSSFKGLVDNIKNDAYNINKMKEEVLNFKN